MKELLTGNAAIARGAFESGVILAAGYPGTPSTEILENFRHYDGIYAEWAPNEKVALEVGIGASMAGARVLVTMKHVGVNVAADPLLTVAYTGVNGGLVLVSADDPGMHSSQNEQDNRHYARLAKIPVLEPSDSSEARDMVGLALEMSEEFDIPVMLRTTTRVAHSQSFVELKEPQSRQVREYKKDPQKWLMVPAFGRMRRVSLEERLGRLSLFAETTGVNKIIPGTGKVGVITSGISYQYVREVMPGAPVLKLGMVYPLPVDKIKEFAASVDRVFVVEELEPFLEEHIKLMGIDVTGKAIFPSRGEFSVSMLRQGFAKAGIIEEEVTGPPGYPDLPQTPVRPPVLCSGCPHRGVFYTLRKMKLVVTGDIGCYTLGGLPPLGGIDACVCMGASIGMAHGIDRAVPSFHGRTVAVIGDSTFMHSGITGLVNVVYNGGNSTVLILDNSTTAMTGHQDHATTGKTLMGKAAPVVDLEALARALGVSRVFTVDPLELDDVERLVKQEVEYPGPSVIIAKRPCVLLKRVEANPMTVNAELCTGCKTCLKLSCPSISVVDKLCQVDPVSCTGCGVCAQVCKFKALEKPKGGSASA